MSNCRYRHGFPKDTVRGFPLQRINYKSACMLTVLQSYSLIQELQESEGINHEMAAYRHRSIEGEDLYKVVLLGDYGVGKTSLFRRLRDGSFAEGLSTSLSSVGMDKCTRSFQMDNGTSVKVSLLLLDQLIEVHTCL